jgi:hypothetical protein
MEIVVDPPGFGAGSESQCTKKQVDTLEVRKKTRRSWQEGMREYAKLLIKESAPDIDFIEEHIEDALWGWDI